MKLTTGRICVSAGVVLLIVTTMECTGTSRVIGKLLFRPFWPFVVLAMYALWAPDPPAADSVPPEPSSDGAVG